MPNASQIHAAVPSEVTARIRAAADELRRADALHNSLPLGPREVLAVKDIATALDAAADALSQTGFAAAASILRDFAVTPHAQWLGERRRKSQKATGAVSPQKPSEKQREASRRNGRWIGQKASNWQPFREEFANRIAPGEWYTAQAYKMIHAIRTDILRGEYPKYLDDLITHDVPVRLERKVAKLVQQGPWGHVRYALGAWRPRSYNKSNETNAQRICRRLSKVVAANTPFFLRVRKGLRYYVGRMSDVAEVAKGGDQLMDSELFIRYSPKEKWQPVNVPFYRPRRFSAAALDEHKRICTERGEGSVEAITYRWQVFRIRPNASTIESLKKQLGPKDRLVRGLTQRSRYVVKMQHVEDFDALAEQVIDENSSSNARPSIRY